MAYNFPNSPSNGDTVTVNGIIYTYISADNAWKTGTGQTPAILSDGSTPTLGSGITAAEIRTLIGSVDLSSVSSDIIPDGDGTRDLGSSSAKFKDLHLSGNTLHLGAQTLEADSSSIILSQLKIGTGSSQVTLSGGAGGTLETGGSTIFSGVFADLTSKPTTLAGYGITDGATTSYVTTQITNLVDSAPSALNTLNELAAALNDDANFSTTVTNSLATKAPLASPTLTGTPAAPTASSGTNTTQIATTAFVQANKFSGAFTALTGKPTTIAGYGITDAFSGAFSALTGKPTTIAGYGITDALTTGADADIGSNDFITTGKVYFANMFSQTSNLPSATTYHGMFAHVHATGAAYFAHGGNWIELANKSYVDTQVTALIDSAPGALDTLNELAAALNDDANFATTVTTSLGLKAPLASPTFTGAPAAPTASSGTNTTQVATTAFVQAAVSAAGGYNDASVDTHLNRSTASPNEVLSWNGSDYDWVAQSGGGGGASVTTSDAAPSSPSAGDLWYNTSAGGLFVYYTDANSSQWVEVVGKTGATGDTGAQGPAGSAAITRYANLAAFPSSPTISDLAYANDTNQLYIYNGSTWERMYHGTDEVLSFDNDPASEIVLASDGTATNVSLPATDPEGFPITYSYDTNPSNQPQATVTNSGSTFTLTPSTNAANAGNFTLRFKASDGLHSISKTSNVSLAFAPIVDYLVVAGGGGGSGGDNGGTGGGGGGGGAGGLLTGTSLTLSNSTTYDIIVGNGGNGGAFNGGLGTNGGTSSLSGTGLTTITAIGGGRAGALGNAATGGSGGGGGGRGGSGGAGTAGQGNSGGAGGNWGGGGGGGGAGAAGSAAGGNAGGAGGDGIESSITGTATYYAGGGGGGKNSSATSGAGGLGGGGAGNTAATANTGGGGGGQPAGTGAGRAGGSGIVILRTLATAASTTGSPTVTTDGSYNIYSFTASGSITF